MRITMPPLHPGQQSILSSGARFKVLASGRRWGKSLLGAALCIGAALRGGRAWWVAPTYSMSNIGWREIKRLAVQIPGTDKSDSEKRVTLISGGWVQARSADDPDHLRGEGLDFAVLDECAFMGEAAWNEAIRPALSDRRGGALFISTPKGHNFFWRLYAGATDAPGWARWQQPTTSNPYIDPEEVKVAQSTLPDRVFRQEYLAEFVDDAGAFFRNVDTCATLAQTEPPDAHTGHAVVIGVDWAKQHDYSVFTALCRDCGRVVDWQRHNRVDYRWQRAQLSEMSTKWAGALILAESNSIGEPNIEELAAAGVRVEAFTTTAQSKPPLIEGLAVALEKGILTVPLDYADELKAYEINTHHGRATYGAPEGMHDDRVISLALAWRAAGQAGPLYWS